MERINVLYTCDNTYAPFAGVSMYSLLKNNVELDEIKVYVMGDKISKDNIKRFQSQADMFGRDFEYIDGTDCIKEMKTMNLQTYRGCYAPNFRLFFSEWIKEDVERLLYLDCDTIICGKLDSLFQIDIGEKSLAVVQESLGYWYKSILGFEKECPYFNAGMILFDVKKWKENHCQERLFADMRKLENMHPNTDQDYLNITLKEDICIIPPKYNFQPIHIAYSDKAYFRCYTRNGYYSVDEIKEARENPVILHTYRFLGQFPWNTKNLHPFREIYKEYQMNSLWADMQDIDNNFSGVMKLERLLYCVIPKSIFLFIFSKMHFYSFVKSERNLRKIYNA